MLNLLNRSSIFFSVPFLVLIFVSGCNSSAPGTAKTASETPLPADSNVFKTSLPTQKQTQGESTEGSHEIELLYGKWQPIAYIDINGQQVDLTELPDAEKESLSWEFTPDGYIKLGDIEGTFEVEGDRIIAKNESSGNQKEFEFSVSETELNIISDDGATLKLSRES